MHDMQTIAYHSKTDHRYWTYAAVIGPCKPVHSIYLKWGIALNPDTGNVDEEILCSNLNKAADVYINRVNKCPCGDTVINLYKGSDSSQYQSMRKHLQVFLKGSQKKKDELQMKEPELYSHFVEVWKVRDNHYHKELPPQYIFLLTCCYKADCPHPLCKDGPPAEELRWYPNGPTLSQNLLPVPDPAQPYGNPNCNSCEEACCGHFLSPEQVCQSDRPPMSQPPSVLLKEFFSSQQCCQPTDTVLQRLGKEMLLPVSEVALWLEHLQGVVTNQKQGVAKAALSRKQKASKASKASKETQETRPQIYRCGVCHAMFEVETQEEELWVGCEYCDGWFHAVCVNIDLQCVPEEFV